MLDFGTVKPGTTLVVPFHTFDSNDPSASVTITGLAVTDIEVYKDGGATTRASDSGYALLDTDGIDFDSKTGIHGFSIDLADNDADDFYEAGSQYFAVIASITVDGATVNFVAATWRIGYPGAILDTIIATRTSATVFVLEEGAPDDDVYNGCIVYIHDQASAVQMEIGVCSDYDGGATTLTLAADPGRFTTVAGDNISIFPPSSVTTVAGPVDVNVTEMVGGAVPAPATTGIPDVNVREWLDTAVSANTAGIPNVNTARINNISTAAAVLSSWLAQGRTRTADSGTTTTIVDAALTEADDLWNGALLIFTSGANDIRTAIVTGFDAASDTITFAPAVPDAVTTEGYVIVPGLGWAARDLANTTDGLSALKTLLDAIPTTAMRGTDSAALASVCTEARLSELDAGNLPTDIANLNDYDPTAQMVESYAANGVAPTRDQCMFAIHQMLMQFGIAGTSITVRKLDDATTAFVVTLDDATGPTDAKRV